MKARPIASLTLLALLGAMIAPQLSQAADAPKMGGGYTDVVPIPVIGGNFRERSIDRTRVTIRVLKLGVSSRV